MNCGQELSQCICIDGPTRPRSIEELKKERDAAREELLLRLKKRL